MKARKKLKARRKDRDFRKTAGAALAAAAVLICLFALRDAPRGTVRSFAAAGETETAAPPYVPPGGTVRINEADADELISLPGVGETLARAILDERERNGPFRFPEDIMAVKGIGPAKLAQILPYLDLDEEGE